VTLAMTLRNTGQIYEHKNDYYQRALEMYQRLSIAPDDQSKISKLNDYIDRTRREMNK
jgi:hypothetical protein